MGRVEKFSLIYWTMIITFLTVTIYGYKQGWWDLIDA